MNSQPDEQPSDDELRKAWHVVSTGTPHDRLAPDLRSAADAAVRADRAHWTIIAGHWQLEWNDPEGTP